MKKKNVDLEFEKQKEAILKQARSVTQSPERAEAELLRRVDRLTEDAYVDGNTQKYAWEYELENYRKARIKEHFYTLGAICGILALILVLVLHFGNILTFLMKL
jgi:hypothetical protein